MNINSNGETIQRKKRNKSEIFSKTLIFSQHHSRRNIPEYDLVIRRYTRRELEEAENSLKNLIRVGAGESTAETKNTGTTLIRPTITVMGEFVRCNYRSTTKAVN